MSLKAVGLEDLRDRLDPTGAGHEAGRQGLPPLDAKYDPHERAITDEIERQMQDSCNELADQRNERLRHIAELPSAGLAGDMHAAVRRAVSRLEHAAKSAEMELEQARLESEERQRDFFRFRKAHRLTAREPHYPDSGGRWLRVGILLFLGLCESVANSAFLAKGNELGLVGAYVVAFGISVLNIPTAFLFGRLSCHLSHVRVARRIVAGAATAFNFLFALILNLGVAHYREVSGDLIGTAGVEVVTRMRQNPLGLQDAESWLLFAIGFLFSVISFIDGRTYDDPYPGYGRLHRTWRAAQEEAAGVVESVQEELSDVLDESLEEIKRLAHDFRRRPEEMRRIADGWQRSIMEFERLLVHLQQIGEILIQEYREANREARPDRNIPQIHRSHWKLSIPEVDREDLPGLDSRGLTAEESRQIEEEYRRATDLIHKRFNQVRDWVGERGAAQTAMAPGVRSSGAGRS